MVHKLLILIPSGPLTPAAQAARAKKKASFPGEEASKENGPPSLGEERADDGYRKFVVFAEPDQTVAKLKERILTQYKVLFARDGTSVPKNIPFLKDADGFVCDDTYTVAECFAPGSKVFAEKPSTRSRKRKSKVRANGGNVDEAGERPNQLQHGEEEDDDDEEEEEEDEEEDSTPEPTGALAPFPPVPAAKKENQATAKRQKTEKGGKPEMAEEADKLEKKSGDVKKERKKRYQQQTSEKSAGAASPVPPAPVTGPPSVTKPKKRGAPAAAPSETSSKKVTSKVTPKKLASESGGNKE